MSNSQTLVPSENGIYTVRSLFPNSSENRGLLEEFQNVDIPTVEGYTPPLVSTDSCFDLSNLPKFSTLQELLVNLCDTMIRFDGCPKNYQKADYEQLIKTMTNGLVFLYTNQSSPVINEHPVNFIGNAYLNTNPYNDANVKNNHYPGIYFAQDTGQYPIFGVTVTPADMLKSIVILTPNISNGLVLGYNKSSYRLNIEGDKHYRYDSNNKKSVWAITHNLGKLPSVVITDSGGTTFEGTVQHIDTNNLTITFSAPFKGFADLN